MNEWGQFVPDRRPVGYRAMQARRKQMIVYLSGRQIVIETNIAWALPYWTKRKQINDKITWRMK